jgi:phosphoribosylamine--glycine ligase
MRVLILGSGGREHALGWAVRNSDPGVEVVFCPGNGGTEAIGRNHPGNLLDRDAMRQLVAEVRPDLTVIGPEGPLVAGIADEIRAAGYPVFGPSARAAQIEGSKVYAKTLMRSHGIPTAAFEVFEKPEKARAYIRKGLFPIVVKADGLAAGKGAIIARSLEEGDAAIADLMESGRFGAAAERILIESFLEGEEVSAFAIAKDGEFRLLPLSQDHKAIGEGDVGPNTGGMGAYAPFPRATPELVRSIEEDVIAPTLRALMDDDRSFRGLLYAGLILSHDRPMVLEYNCRFGDPETQAVLPLLGDGFLDALRATASGDERLPEIGLRSVAGPPSGAAAAVVLASRGYPGDYEVGFPIRGIEQAEALPETWVFHAGTRRTRDALSTSGGRVLAVAARGADLRSALGRAYEGVSLIEYEGKTFRRDIGRKGLATRRGGEPA